MKTDEMFSGTKEKLCAAVNKIKMCLKPFFRCNLCNFFVAFCACAVLMTVDVKISFKNDETKRKTMKN